MLRRVNQERQADLRDARSELRRCQTSLTLWPLVELARRNGLPIEQLAQLAGVRVADLRDPGVRFTQPAANRVADLVCELTGEDACVRAAEMVEAGHFALFELLARTAPSVGLALALGSRFFWLIHAEVRCAHSVEPDGSHLVRLIMAPELALHPGFIELTFGLWSTSMRRETERPSADPGEVWFRHAPPRDRTAYDRILGPHVKFGMPENQFCFTAAIARLPLTRKNPTVHAAALQAARDFLRTRT